MRSCWSAKDTLGNVTRRRETMVHTGTVRAVASSDSACNDGRFEMEAGLQSHSWPFKTFSRLVDGSSRWQLGMCTEPGDADPPWWRLFLLPAEIGISTFAAIVLSITSLALSWYHKIAAARSWEAVGLCHATKWRTTNYRNFLMMEKIITRYNRVVRAFLATRLRMYLQHTPASLQTTVLWAWAKMRFLQNWPFVCSISWSDKACETLLWRPSSWFRQLLSMMLLSYQYKLIVSIHINSQSLRRVRFAKKATWWSELP